MKVGFMVANNACFGQMSLFNSLSGLDERTLNWLIHSWAFPFRLFIYPLINPHLFDCLYSVIDSRPANPPQVVVALLIIQNMFNKTDDEMHDWMMSNAVDIRFATNTLGIPTSKLPTHDKQLSRFRMRNLNYANEHDGHSPLNECVQSLSIGLSALMGLNLDNVRIDSTMVAANMARMNRIELLYTANSKVIKMLIEDHDDNYASTILKDLDLDHYQESSDHNSVIYYNKSNADEKGAKLAQEAQKILGLCSEAELETELGKDYVRLLSEQTVVDEHGNRRMATSDDHTMSSRGIQNMADTMATYREKAKKEFIGYIVNLVEAVGKQGSLVLSWDFEQNVVSDPVMAMAFMREADEILSGMQSYRTQFNLPEDMDMTQCQHLLSEKMVLVANLIREAQQQGRVIPRSIIADPALKGLFQNEADRATALEDQQISLDELLKDMNLLEFPIITPTESDTASQNIETATTETIDTTVQAQKAATTETIEDNGTTAQMQDPATTNTIEAAEPVQETVTTGTADQVQTATTIETTETTEANKAAAQVQETATDEVNETVSQAQGTVEQYQTSTDTVISDTDTVQTPENAPRTESHEQPESASEIQPAPCVQATTTTDAAGKTTFTWTVLGKPGMEGIKLPEFAELPPDQRRQAYLYGVRERYPLSFDADGNVRFCVADGAYSTDELHTLAEEKGFHLLPTDLLGKRSNPLIGLFSFSDDKTQVLRCAMGYEPISQKMYKTGSISMEMDANKCHQCPFRNDCNGQFLKTRESKKVIVSPNVQARIITEAIMGTEEYKDIGRFRNGVETIPGFLHNVLDIDHLPIGYDIKKVHMDLKIGALNCRKFILFAFNKTHYAANPILDRV